MSSIEIPVIAGDGIGPEITAAVLKVVDAAVERNGESLSWVPVTAGLSALEEGRELIPCHAARHAGAAAVGCVAR